MNPFAAIAAAAVIAAVISLPVSLLVLRLSGGYFAVATLVIAAVFQIAATLSPSVGGTTGVSVPGLAGYDPVLREALIYWAVGAGQRPVRLVPPPGGLPGAFAPSLTGCSPSG